MRHADLLNPFRDLIKKNTWNWNSDHDLAFKNMKIAFVNCIKLSHYMPGKIYRLQTDASDVGLSGILYQIDDSGEIKIVSLVSRCLNTAEVDYTTTEKELLAIVYAVGKLRTYLLGTRFLIITDHKGLTFLNSTQYLNSRLIRWSLFMQQFDFDVEYCRGQDNLVADFFSRNPRGRFESSVQPHFSIDVLHHESKLFYINKCSGVYFHKGLNDSLNNLATLQRQDSKVNHILTNLNGALSRYFTLKNDILFRNDESRKTWQVVIPEILTRKIIDCVHSKLGHPGAFKTIAYVRQYYFWRSMGKEIQKFVNNCDLCQRVKPSNINMESEYRMVYSSKPSDLVSVDFYGPLPRSTAGMEYVFVVLDVFSKYVKLYPIKKENADTILRKLINSYFPECGKPNRILSDHGSQFTSPKWESRLRDQGVKVVFSSIRHPQGNPVERVMREIGRLFRTLCSDRHTRWVRSVPDIEFFLNATAHVSTGFCPLELHFGKKPKDQIFDILRFPDNIPMSRNAMIILAKERLNKSFERRKKAQKALSSIELQQNDLVLLRVPKHSDSIKKVTRKFFHLYYGPYLILKDLKNGSFELVDPENHDKQIGIFHQSNLEKYNQSE